MPGGSWEAARAANGILRAVGSDIPESNLADLVNDARFPDNPCSNKPGTVLSEEAVLSVTPDLTPPVLVSASNLRGDRVVVTFSEPVEVATATNPAHSGLDQGVTVVGAADQFHFGHQQRSGNFDVKVRVAHLGHTDLWAKAGRKEVRQRSNSLS